MPGGRLPRLLLMSLVLLGTQAMTTGAESRIDSMTVDYEELLDYYFKYRLRDEQVLVLELAALVPGSAQVLLDGVPLEADRDYQLDPILGRLSLTRPAPGALLEFRARRQLGGLPRMLSLAPFRSWQDLRADLERELRESGETKLARPAESSGAGSAREPGALSLGGSKSLVLRLGNGEDLALEQSLRLQLQGRLSDSTQVEAVLRDDDLPFQPEGNTERLEELDKVYLRVWGPAGSAQVGDFVFAAPERRLTPFQRDFQGIQGEWRGDRAAAGLWLASSQGLFRSEEFYGTGGLQGPYELLSALREGGAVILAGSERVRLNGTLLTRGRDRDYVIDYDLGTLTFSSQRLVNEGDIIRVDFRYSQENWQRGAWGGSAGGRLGALRLSLLHFEEKDDLERPLSFTLDAERREVFALAGDDAAAAVTDGVSPRPGAGRYVLSHEDPVHPDIETYTWVDSLGDFLLRFREVGSGLGDYSAVGLSGDGERIFAYAGQGAGAFLLGERLTAPESYRLESLRLDWDLGPLRAEGEVALSEYDANLLSTRDDGDNTGLAFRAELGGPLAAPAGRSLDLALALENREARFRFPGATRGVSEYRRWNLPWLPGRLGESRGSAALAWGEDPFAQLRASLEGLRLERRFEGLRGELAAGGRWRGLGLRGEASSVSSEDSLLGAGSRTEQSLRLQLPMPLWRELRLNEVRATLEEPDSLDAQRAPEQRGNYRRRGAELRFGSRGGGRPWRLDWLEEEITSGPDTRDRQRRLALEAEGALPGRGRLGLSARYQRRRGSLDNEQFQAEARAGWLARPGAWGGESVYRLGSRRQRLRQSQLVIVGLGQGDLNEDGIYVGEGEGDYRRLTVLGEESVRTQNLEVELRLQRPELQRGGRWKRLGVETRLILREENRDADPWQLALLAPSHMRKAGSTLLGSLELNQELRYRLVESGLDFRYRFRHLDRLDERDSAGGRRENEDTHRLRTRRSGARSNLEWILLYAELERASVEGQGGNYRVREWGADLEATRHLPRRASLKLSGRGRRRRDALRVLALRELALAPGLTLSPVGSLRIETAWEFSHSTYEEGDPGMGRPWFFDAPGWKRTLRVDASVQAGANLTLSAHYELRETVDEPRRQRLRMESRAFF